MNERIAALKDSEIAEICLYTVEALSSLLAGLVAERLAAGLPEPTTRDFSLVILEFARTLQKCVDEG